jgi:hypothetical protein
VPFQVRFERAKFKELFRIKESGFRPGCIAASQKRIRLPRYQQRNNNWWGAHYQLVWWLGYYEFEADRLFDEVVPAIGLNQWWSQRTPY